MVRKQPLIDTHIHLFDPAKFPYHPRATYKPEPVLQGDYERFAREAGISGAVIVHPEPYQDDHSYLEHCFASEATPGFFKGTCLFDPVDPATPGRMRALVKKWPKRIVALRVHAFTPKGGVPLKEGPIRNRDMEDPRFAAAWDEARSLGLALQFHFMPHHAAGIEKHLMRRPDTKVVLDHLGRPAQGDAGDWEGVLRLARYKNVYFKFSNLNENSKQPHPHADLKPMIKRAWDAFGERRIVWGYFGVNLSEFRRYSEWVDFHFDFATDEQRAKIRGGNAARLYKFPV
jgi:predicted TIM-barrel fold metal-dependent hydrolase